MIKSELPEMCHFYSRVIEITRPILIPTIYSTRENCIQPSRFPTNKFQHAVSFFLVRPSRTVFQYAVFVEEIRTHTQNWLCCIVCVKKMIDGVSLFRKVCVRTMTFWEQVYVISIHHYMS